MHKMLLKVSAASPPPPPSSKLKTNMLRKSLSYYITLDVLIKSL